MPTEAEKRKGLPGTEPPVTENGAIHAPEGEENPLSEREMDVARLLVTGASNTEIARDLVISPQTVKVHLRNIFEKLQVNSRTEASLVLLQRGWVVVPGVEIEDAEAVQAAPPEPAPLEDVAATPARWQQVVLVAALAIWLGSLVLPRVWGAPPASNLLTDVEQTVNAPAVIEMESRWEVRAPLNEPRSRMGGAQTGDVVYVIGGENEDGKTVATVTAYDLRANQWRAVRTLPKPLANVAAASLDGRVYVAGGSTHDAGEPPTFSISDELLAYDPEAGTWESVAKLPGPLAGASLVSQPDALYLLGGWDGSAMHDEVWRLEMDAAGAPAASWELVTRLTTPKAFFGATTVDDDLYVLGGYDGQHELAEAAVLNVASGEWQELPPLAAPRGGLSAVFDGLAVFALGGGWTRAVDTHERFDPATGQWSNFPSPVKGEWRNFVIGTHDGQLALIGGWSGGYLDTHLAYHSTFRALLPVIKTD